MNINSTSEVQMFRCLQLAYNYKKISKKQLSYQWNNTNIIVTLTYNANEIITYSEQNIEADNVKKVFLYSSEINIF